MPGGYLSDGWGRHEGLGTECSCTLANHSGISIVKPLTPWRMNVTNPWHIALISTRVHAHRPVPAHLGGTVPGSKPSPLQLHLFPQPTVPSEPGRCQTGFFRLPAHAWQAVSPLRTQVHMCHLHDPLCWHRCSWPASSQQASAMQGLLPRSVKVKKAAEVLSLHLK